MRTIARLKIGQGFLAPFLCGLPFEQEDRQRAKEGQTAGGMGVSDGATVLILDAIPAMVLAVFNTPVVAGQL
jgi:hypothetical protein